MYAPGASFVSEGNESTPGDGDVGSSGLTACDALDSQPAQPPTLGTWILTSASAPLAFLFSYNVTCVFVCVCVPESERAIDAVREHVCKNV